MATVIQVANALVAATGTTIGAQHGCPQGDQVAIEVTTSAIVGPPSLVVSVQWTQGGGQYAPADPADVFTAITTATSAVKSFARKGVGFQLVYVVAGAASSITVTATALPVGSGFAF